MHVLTSEVHCLGFSLDGDLFPVDPQRGSDDTRLVWSVSGILTDWQHKRKNGKANFFLSNGLVLGTLDSQSLGPGSVLRTGDCLSILLPQTTLMRIWALLFCNSHFMCF